VVVGFAFHMIYYCAGILLTAGSCIIYFNCFFDRKSQSLITPENDDPVYKMLMTKLFVRIKFFEILILAIFLYVLMYSAYIMNAFDNSLFMDPDFSITGNLSQVALLPSILIFLTSLITPVILKKKMSKAGFICLTLISIAIPCSVFILDMLTGFTDKKQLMTTIPFAVIGLAIIFYLISIAIVIRKK
jgi:hypothetical protein